MTSREKQLSIVPFVLLVLISIIGLIVEKVPTSINLEGLDKSDIAWMIMASAMVLIMTPGLAFFYGGMVNRKNLIATMLQSFICMGVISILWVVVGFSLAFGDPWITIGGYSILGNPFTYFMFNNVLEAPAVGTIPLILFAFFQMKFAVITPALITGSFSDRIKFTSYILFACLFSIFVYSPLAHMTWHAEGLLMQLGVLDFAGGTVVHISAGTAALVAAIYLGKRKELEEPEPANIPYVLIGTGLLWFGWFGFNAGSALSTSIVSITAYAVTNTAAAAAGITWVLFDAVKGKKPSAMGFSIGAVVGLVAITPSAGFVTLPASIFIGVFSAIISNVVVDFTKKRGLVDDTLDVFPCHGVGGMTGMLLTGVFANAAINEVVGDVLGNGIFYGGNALFWYHLAALIGVFIFAFAGSWALLWLTDKISPLRVSEAEEMVGLDESQHGESYVLRVYNKEKEVI